MEVHICKLYIVCHESVQRESTLKNEELVKTSRDGDYHHYTCPEYH